MSVTRVEIADHLVSRLEQGLEALRTEFQSPARVPSCAIDDVLPETLARRIYAEFPSSGRMTFKTSIKERKYVAAQMDAHPPILEEAVYAFQDARVVDLASRITGLGGMEPDFELYAGGISAMPLGGYLKPHLDNSHDKGRNRYRALNLLFYVTPDWRAEYGGNLELWDEGPRGSPRVIPSLFNRLVLMATNRRSWHSVSEIVHPGVRCCVSNYYFSERSPDEVDYFHATSFRGRPKEVLGDAVMRADNAVRTAVLKALGTRGYDNPHVYRRRER
jgi:Rps23 Pro-64 3,4-dihydroxylase Tpa1-like proline 4-hydroxylase